MEVVILLSGMHTVAMPDSLEERHDRGIEAGRDTCESCIPAMTVPPGPFVKLMDFEASLCPTSLDDQIVKGCTTFVIEGPKLSHGLLLCNPPMSHGDEHGWGERRLLAKLLPEVSSPAFLARSSCGGFDSFAKFCLAMRQKFILPSRYKTQPGHGNKTKTISYLTPV